MDYAQLDRDYVWHPFTQQQGWSAEAPLVVERGEGSYLFDTEGRRYLDGTAALWCNVHGHRHPAIDRAVREQLDRVAHTTMLGLTHPGATELAARLVEIAPEGLSRVFYSDSGSTAAEIALKIAFQYPQQRGGEHARPTPRSGGGATPPAGPSSYACARPTTATRSAPSRSAASTSSTPPTGRC